MSHILKFQIPSHTSFLHQQSFTHQDPKAKKKNSLYLKQDNYIRLKGEEKEPQSIIKQEQGAYLTRQHHSLTQLSRAKQKIIPQLQHKKKKNKHIISAVNLTKNTEESKVKSSNITKRKQSTDFKQKVKEKTQDFRIIANCLEQYIKEQRKKNADVNLNEVFKIIVAFTRTEIGPFSKVLEKLITQIVLSIQSSLPQPLLKSNLKKLASFDTPSKSNLTHGQQSKETIKKVHNSKQHIKKLEPSREVNKLQQNLGRLKYESNRLKYFLEEISKGKEDKSKQEEKGKIKQQKIEELQELRQIAENQAEIIQELQNCSEEGTFRSDSQN